MPIPKPQKNEKEDDFIERCMGDDTMKEEYPDNDQRLAICYDSWRKDKGEEKMKEEKAKYTCECIECKHTIETDEHCKDLKCSECGGEMRRKERPGPGRSREDLSKDILDYLEKQGYSNVERRSFAVEEFRVLKDDDTPRIVGYAAIFNKESEPIEFFGQTFTEKIAPGAFKNAIKDSDTRSTFNHDPNILLGRKSAGTLKLKEDERGLFTETIPPDTQYIRDVVLTPIDRGDIKEMSFAFTIKAEEWKEDKEKKTVQRTLVEVDKLYDIAPVTYPAYDDTTVALRSFNKWQEENKRSEPEPIGVTPEGWEDITSADADKLEENLRRLDMRARKLEVSKL